MGKRPVERINPYNSIDNQRPDVNAQDMFPLMVLEFLNLGLIYLTSDNKIERWLIF